ILWWRAAQSLIDLLAIIWLNRWSKTLGIRRFNSRQPKLGLLRCLLLGKTYKRLKQAVQFEENFPSIDSADFFLNLMLFNVVNPAGSRSEEHTSELQSTM